MFSVFPDVGLQHNRIAAAEHAAAIDEFFSHVSNFGYVCMHRDEIAVRQDEPRESSGMLLYS